jgi:prepilin-type N-terminal cleavage/methylation domain-containing protein
MMAIAGKRRVGPARPGFTLIEMLVVIGIIAVLAAILLPVITTAQRKARMTACQANLNQLALGLKMYKTDFRAYPLGSTGNLATLADHTGKAPGTNGYATFDTTSGRKSRLGALYPGYVTDQKSFICPEEDGLTRLAARPNAATPADYNDGIDEEVLEVGGGDPANNENYTSCSYDDFYNYYGFGSDGTPNTAPPASYGRKAKMLLNRYAPDTTLVSYCRDHEDQDNVDASMDVIVRIDATTDRVAHGVYKWDVQPETTE